MEKKIVSGIMTVLLLIYVLPIAFVHIVHSVDIIHDVAVTGIGLHHSTVYGDIPVLSHTTYNGPDVNSIYVDAEISNNGDVAEEVEVTFTYTIADVPTTIGVVFVDVAAGSTEIASVSFDTRNFPAGYLPIKVEATEVYNEVNTLDNNMTTFLLIKHVGDVESDGDVDMFDFGIFAQAYGTSFGDVHYDVECDFDRDGDVDMFDFGDLAQNYGKTA